MSSHELHSAGECERPAREATKIIATGAMDATICASCAAPELIRVWLTPIYFARVSNR